MRDDETDRRTPKRGGSAARRAGRIALRVAGLIAALLVVAAGLLVYMMRGSLPDTRGERRVLELENPVTVERDAAGMPFIRGRSRGDVAYAMGFVHAQERWFQMDLLRRRAAGELAELFGEPALNADLAVRRHRFRWLARRVVEDAAPEERRLLAAYAAGVNAGLRHLRVRPVEYLLLRARPEPWREEDTILAVHAMYLVLQDDRGLRERMFAAMRDGMSEQLFEVFAARGTPWDAPLVGGALQGPPLPGPESVDLAAPEAVPGTHGASRRGESASDRLATGSNAWAVAGSRTSSGSAIVANDMHLPLSVPGTWYRIALEWPDDEGRTRRVVGVSLPGTPLVAVGSNESVAWGFTNSYGDWSDLVVVESDPDDPDKYLTPEGSEPYTRVEQTHRVARGETKRDVVTWTRWGPIVGVDHEGRSLALQWIAHDTRAVNLGLRRLETAGSVREALAAAASVGVPAQNLIVGDRSGSIGWTVIGPIPRRRACGDPRLPRPGKDSSCVWDGLVELEEYPRLVDPPSGVLWTANNRAVDGPWLDRLGDGGYALGARAAQIRDALEGRSSLAERDMLALQLDDRALFLSRWRELLLETTSGVWVGGDARRRLFRSLVDAWGGRASVDSVGYRLVRAFRGFVMEEALDPLFAGCRQLDERCDPRRLPQVEGALWRLVEERPRHLLGGGHGSWEELLAAAAGRTLDHFEALPGSLEGATWGRRNTLRSRHPLGAAVGPLARWLDMPAVELPGDAYMPRVQSPFFGASQRMAVSPGREEEGILHTPAGQSGHPLSSHYADGHDAWRRGEPDPMLPGPPIETLTLVPESP